MDEARAAVKEWDASRKKKRSKTDSDDGSGSDDGEDTHRRKKKKSKVSKSAKPVENKQISYRDRAKERRKGATKQEMPNNVTIPCAHEPFTISCQSSRPILLSVPSSLKKKLSSLGSP